MQEIPPNYRFPRPGISTPGALLAQLSHKTGVAVAETVPGDRASRPARAGVVVCDQAVFSSVRSSLGQGYRIVAASKGITQSERRDITARSPSHEGLCGSGPDVQGFASYPVSSGRWCVAYSCTAGAEHTGRGGDRVSTRIVLLNMPDMRAYTFDPCLVLEAMRLGGLCQADLDLPASQVLPAVELEICAAGDVDVQTVQMWQQHSKTLSLALDRLLDNERLLVVTGEPSTQAAIGLIRSLPAPRRQHLTVSCNLRFSVGRAAELNLIPESNAKTESLIRGQKVRLIEFARPEAQSATPSSWVQLAARRWQMGRADHWVKETARLFEGYSRQAAEEWADLLLAQDAISSHEAIDILGMLRHRQGQSPSTQPAREDLDMLRALAAHRLQLLARADGALSIPTWYPQLYSAYQAGHAPADALAGAVMAAWTCMAQHDPLGAVEAALNLGESTTHNEKVTAIEPVLPELLSRLSTTISAMTPNQLQIAARLMDRWTRLWSTQDAAKEISAAVQRCLAKGATPA